MGTLRLDAPKQHQQEAVKPRPLQADPTSTRTIPLAVLLGHHADVKQGGEFEGIEALELDGAPCIMMHLAQQLGVPVGITVHLR
jgi:hypothetical protein